MLSSSVFRNTLTTPSPCPTLSHNPRRGTAGKAYKDDAEKAYRKGLYEARSSEVTKHNQGNRTFKLALNFLCVVQGSVTM